MLKFMVWQSADERLRAVETVFRKILQTLDLHSRKPNLQTPAQSTASHRRPPPAIADARQPPVTFLQVIPTSGDLLNLLDLLRHSPQSKPNLHTLAQSTAGHRRPSSTSGEPRSVGFFFENHWVFSCLLYLHDLEVTETADFQKDLCLDSLDRVELVMAFEQEFSIEIPDEKADRLTCCADVAKYIISEAQQKNMENS
ncbi:hypothetical protein C3L33_06511, partial [Rhododendron williamsianum]